MLNARRKVSNIKIETKVLCRYDVYISYGLHGANIVIGLTFIIS